MTFVNLFALELAVFFRYWTFAVNAFFLFITFDFNQS